MPTTRATGDLITASIWNSDIVSDLKYLGGTDGRSTAFPGSPTDGQRFRYVADGTNGVVWDFEYETATTKWRFVGGPPLSAEVATDETSVNTAYVALATPLPLTIPLAGDYDVKLEAFLQCDGNSTALYSYDIGGTAAVDADAIKFYGATSTEAASCSRTKRKTGITASTTLTTKIKSGGPGVGGQVHAANRRISVTPVRCS